MRATLPRILAIVMTVVPALAAFGQAELPEGLTSRSNLSPSEEQSVADWATSLWSSVDAQTPTAAREARRRLVEPLLSEDTSASFRLAMDQSLSGELRQAMAGDDVFRGVNAALLMGWLATDRSVRVLTETTQNGPVAVRFAAISGLGKAFRASSFAPVAFQAQVGNDAVDALAGVLAGADDQSILDATSKALIYAMDVPEAAIAGFGARAGERLAQAIGERLNTLPIDDHLGNRLKPLIRAMADVRTAITQRRGDVSAGWRSSIMEMYGRAGALGFRFVRAERAGQISDAQAESARQTVGTVIQVVSTIPPLLRIDRAMQDQLNNIGLASNFSRAPQDDGDAYQRSATSLIRLLGEDFGLSSDRFNIGG